MPRVPSVLLLLLLLLLLQVPRARADGAAPPPPPPHRLLPDDAGLDVPWLLAYDPASDRQRLIDSAALAALSGDSSAAAARKPLLPGGPFLQCWSACMRRRQHNASAGPHYGPLAPAPPGGAAAAAPGLAEGPEGAHTVGTLASLAADGGGGGGCAAPPPVRNLSLALPCAPSVASFLAGAGRRAPLLLHSFGNATAMAPVTRAWLWYVHRAGLGDHVVFVGAAAGDCAFASRYAPCLLHPPCGGGGGGGGGAVRPPGAHNACNPIDTKWLYALLALRAGADVVLTDTDALPLGPLLGVLRAAPAPVQALSDRWYGGMGGLRYCNRVPNAPCVSTGFTYFRSGLPAVEAAVEAMVSGLASSPGWEQEMWQPIAAALRRRGLLAVLPHRGARAFANWGVFKAALEAREAITVALLHAGYVRGGDKERTFRCAQLWPHLPPLPPPGAGAGETS